MKRNLIRATLTVLVGVGLLYIGDNLVLRYRMRTPGAAFGSVTVKRYYAIRHKDQRVEFDPIDPEVRPCAHSLFPQFGTNPCWYVSRTTVERIDM
jgi:hypothetical protein